MITCKEVSASIRVDEVDLPHFDASFDESTNTMTCWIPSQPGKSYSVWWKQNSEVAPGGCITGRIYLDGAKAQACGGCNYFGQETTKFGAPISHGQELAFIFAELELTEDDAQRISPEKSADLGSIKLEISRTIQGPMVQSVERPVDVNEITSGILQVHEKSKKLGGHVTKLGPVRYLPQRGFCTMLPYNVFDPRHWVLFVFKYRPAAVLQAMEIMPGTRPSKAIEEIELSSDSESEEGPTRPRKKRKDLRKLVLKRQLEEIEEEDGTLRRKKVKLENEIVVPAALLAPGVIIDLTDD